MEIRNQKVIRDVIRDVAIGEASGQREYIKPALPPTANDNQPLNINQPPADPTNSNCQNFKKKSFPDHNLQSANMQFKSLIVLAFASAAIASPVIEQRKPQLFSSILHTPH